MQGLNTNIQELDIVTLRHDLPEYHLKQGSQGAVVHCYADGRAFEVEFVAGNSDTIALVTLEPSDIQQPISESPKYDLRGANIGNFVETVQAGGRQEATQHIYAPEQNFDRLLADYRQFFSDLQQKYPAQTPESALPAIIEAEFREIQTKQPQRWQNFLSLKRLWNGGKKATFKIGEHFTEENVWGKAFIAFLEGAIEDVV